MRDYITIGSTPLEEDCAQVGSDNYMSRARRECSVFADQLRRAFGCEPDGAEIRVKSFPHDFGTYLEVVCYYDGENKAAVEYAYRLESETPDVWDAQSRKALGL